jgi:hypothetical protein
MAFEVASLPREPDILIGMIVELHDENTRLLCKRPVSDVF